jgi:type IV pilus assembly protein PilV
MALITATQDNRGFTLVEVMVAMVLLLLGLLNSLVGLMAAADYNLTNALRQEAVRIAQEQLENMRVGPYAPIADNNATLQRQVRKTLQNFQVNTVVIAGGPSNSLKQVVVTVRWIFKNTMRSHVSGTIIRQRVFI